MQKECPICIENIRDTGYVVTECGHNYCLKCFLEHIQSNNKCPMCRNVIIKNKPLQIPNLIAASDDDTPLQNYMSESESINLSSDNETPRFPDISDDDSNSSDGDDTVDRMIRIRAR
tara:strand:- start:20035 stop:20385 length:351 start_codon:yes stop_codon:yes gene_type:complete